ncbi:hypothetical protein L0938_13755 [Paracidovorax citrulli]
MKDVPMVWRFSADNTHLYRGARLRSLETDKRVRLASGDDLLVEFSDGVFATGIVLQTETAETVLQMPRYATQRGTVVTARSWRIEPDSELGLLRVRERIAN